MSGIKIKKPPKNGNAVHLSSILGGEHTDGVVAAKAADNFAWSKVEQRFSVGP
ncbi:hypothetical protein [Hafnia alvei]|uniref:hypothetical protein n=1 Tax=Hafnia alvei TaxID=569 RepID=UPI000AD565BF|nr:hypothetical protein [Hafnia alvei]